MFDFSPIRAIPRAHLDPLVEPVDALLLILMTMRRPIAFETIVVTLFDDRCGHGFFKVTGTEDPDALDVVMDNAAELAWTDPEISGFIVASVRPHGGTDVGDLARWHRADELSSDASIELVEWFVIGETVQCPRALCGVPPRW